MRMKNKNQSVAGCERASKPVRVAGGLSFAIILVLITLSAACADNSPAPGADVTAGRIIENPNEWIGKTVTVSGEVERVIGPRAFLMDSGVNIGELLVVGAEPFPQVPDGGNRGYLVDDTAKVTGTVRRLVIAEIEREVGWDLDPQLEVEYRDRPVLIAGTTNFTPSARRAGAMTPTPAAATDPITDVLIIVTPPDRLPLVGRRVQLSNVQVQSVVGDKGFWVGPSKAQQLFVVLEEADIPGSDAATKVRPGQTVTLSGTVTRVPPIEEARKRWELGEANSATLEKEQVYLRADRIEIAQK